MAVVTFGNEVVIALLLCTAGVIIFWLWSSKNKKDRRSAIKPVSVSVCTTNTEVSVLRAHYSDLQWAFQTPEVFAGVLYSKGIIDEDVRDRAQSQFITCVKKSQILLNAVEQAVKTHPESFKVFLEVLAEELTTRPLHERMVKTYRVHTGHQLFHHDTQSHHDSTSTVQQITSETKETQTIMPLPQRLQLAVPIHCATIKATNSDITPNEDNDERLTLSVSILDASSGTPLKCVVTLQGDEHAPHAGGQVVCFLSLSVSVVGENAVSPWNLYSRRNAETAYRIRRSRKSKYVPNGQATFYMSFSVPEANYIINFNISSVVDEEGIECVGYTVEHYTGFISTVKLCERGAFKAPPLIKYNGAIGSKKFNQLMSVYTKMFYEGKKEDSNMIMSHDLQ